jgi:hypothetical protein
MISKVMPNANGDVSSDNLGFNGSSVGSNAVQVQGSNWNDTTSPNTTSMAYQMALKASGSANVRVLFLFAPVVLYVCLTYLLELDVLQFFLFLGFRRVINRVVVRVRVCHREVRTATQGQSTFTFPSRLRLICPT